MVPRTQSRSEARTNIVEYQTVGFNAQTLFGRAHEAGDTDPTLTTRSRTEVTHGTGKVDLVVRSTKGRDSVDLTVPLTVCPDI